LARVDVETFMRLRVLVIALLLLGACSGADEDVRTIGSESGSGSGSASGSSSASGVESEGEASASGVETEDASSASGSSSALEDGSDIACAPPSEPSGAAITVTLSEWEVGVPTQVPSGTVTVTAGNIGGEPHEVVIVRADDPDSLPVADGQVQEDQLPEGAFIGEIESFAAGDTCSGTFELPPGDYVFFCNIVEEESDGTLESHYEEGMRATVTVG
jgi:plastocyanin